VYSALCVGAQRLETRAFQSSLVSGELDFVASVEDPGMRIHARGIAVEVEAVDAQVAILWGEPCSASCISNTWREVDCAVVDAQSFQARRSLFA
jgi:hypothetical protein